MKTRRPRALKRKLNDLYREQGGIAAFVLARRDKDHRTVAEIALELSQATGEIVRERTLYNWIHEWEPTTETSMEKEVTTA